MVSGDYGSTEPSEVGFPSHWIATVANSQNGIFERHKQMKRKIGSGLGFAAPDIDAPRSRLKLGVDAMLIYAVGDVHGCLELLIAMEEEVVKDAEKLGLPAHLILLGDLVDRGSNSAQVLDYLAENPHDAISRICLAGNHEEMMLDFYLEPDPRDPWLAVGGRETLMSYGIADAASLSRRELKTLVGALVPRDHVDFLVACPVAAETSTHIFTHAGLAADLPLEDQTDRDLMWYRDDMQSDYSEHTKTVVHGHQVVDEPYISGKRINVDVGACATGRLAAVRIFEDHPPFFIGVSAGNPVGRFRWSNLPRGVRTSI